MRIGIDYRPALDARGGIGVYVRELSAALRAHAPDDELELFGHRLRRPRAPAVSSVPRGARLHRRRVPAPVLALAARAGFGADRLLGTVDVLHATDYAPLHASHAPLVATIHDVCFHTLPDCYEPALRARLARVTDDLVARASHIIVPCARVRDELLAHTAAEAACVHVVPHGAPGLQATEAGRVPFGARPYILCVATIQPRKNLLRLLDAFRAVRAQRPDTQLVVVGPAGWASAPIEARLAGDPGVWWEPCVPRARVAQLYRGASVVAYPSLGEGFGFPVLEAWSMDVPVVVGADTAASDLAAGGALAVDPRDADAVAAGLLRVLEDEVLAGALVETGHARLAEFTWERTASQTRAVYAEAAAS
ncbi:MAG: glycosyltransferase family 1 protein [Planctomycetota bacterium]|nr:glycosyltransferase family 1 protein [Planctomycetota bacterium]